MPDMLVRNVKPETMAYLKRRAALNHRTVQDEVRELLDAQEADERKKTREFWEFADAIRAETAGIDTGDSVEQKRTGRRGE